MGTWKSRGLRGSGLEELINIANETYREKGLALVQKIPTPITPIEIENKTKRITLAYFNQKSTVDYIGVVQGIAVCFDAKECSGTGFSLANIHLHQYKFMEEFEKQGGISFLIINFIKKGEIYDLSFSRLKEFWERSLSGGRKSFTYDELGGEILIRSQKEVFLHYLEALSEDLLSRQKEEI